MWFKAINNSHTTCTKYLIQAKCGGNKLIQAKQSTQACYVKINWPILDSKSKMWNTKHKNIFGKKYYNQKQKAHIMLNEQCKCNAWQCLTKL